MRTHIDLFSGLGGFSLACQWNGIQTEVFCEKDDRRRSFLERAYPRIPVVPDIRDFDGTRWRGRFILTAGVPCQPASRAGKQRGKDDDRWLWGEAVRVVKEALPAWCLFENPPGIYDVGIDGILSDLAGIGYETGIVEIPACAVNSPQIRQRVWIVCHRTVADSGSGMFRNGGCSEVDGTAEEISGKVREQRIRADLGTDNNCHMAHSPKDDDRRSDTGESERQVSEPGSCDGSIGSMAHGQRSGRRSDEQGGRPQGRDVDGRDCQKDMENPERRERQTRAISIPATGRPQRELTRSNDWSEYVWVSCADGKLRRAPDDSFSLVDGLHRSILAALGDSINPYVAYEVIKAIRKAAI